MGRYKNWWELQRDEDRDFVRACIGGKLKNVEHSSNRKYSPQAYRHGLVEACKYGHLDVASYLIGIGIDVNDTSCGEPPLHAAIRMGASSMISYLLSVGADPNLRGQLHPKTPIEIALTHRMGSVAMELIRFGAVLPDLSRGQVSSQLQLAIARYDEVSEDLCKKPRWYAGKMLNGLPLIHTVSSWGALPWLKRCVLSGADVNQRCGTRQNSTPLHLACALGKENAIAFLLTAGADEDAKDMNGCMPFERAIEVGQVPAMVAYMKFKGLAAYEKFRGKYLNEWFAHNKSSLEMCTQMMQAALSTETEVQLQQAFGAFDSSIATPQVSVGRVGLIL
jgi:hypothetical protein